MEKQKVIYYTDELNDEFSAGGITARRIDDSYDYGGHGFRWTFLHRFWYNCIIIPFAHVFMAVKYRHKVVGREKLPKTVRGGKADMGSKGAFLFGNHTNEIPDAFIPTLITRPTDMYVIVHPDNVSMPGLGKIVPYLGGLPLPDGGRAMRRFMDRIKEVNAAGKNVTIYPEAHIWPYYTGIRPFKAMSFGYPLTLEAPVYCFTNTYQKCRRLLFRGTPRMVTYIDGPFYPQESAVSNADRKESLRRQVYETMCKRAENNTVEMIRYIKKESQDD